MSDLNLDEDRNNILGVLDELNSFIGFAKSFTRKSGHAHILTIIQNDIFLIQAEIANPPHLLYKPQRISQEQVRFIEMQTSFTEAQLKEIDHFVIPEGTKFACALHCARTISRRVEREMLKYGHQERIKLLNRAASKENLEELSSAIKLYALYFDRVACLAFAMARLANKQSGRKERKPAYYLEEPALNERRTKKGGRNER